MKKKSFFILFFLLPAFFESFAQTLEILPIPKQLQLKTSDFKIFQPRNIFLGTDLISQKDLWFSDFLKNLNKKSKTFWKVNARIESLTSQGIIFTLPQSLGKNYLVHNEVFKNSEAYQIFFEPNQIIITASSAKGFYYASLTLLQALLVNQQDILFPLGCITDWPSFKIRGLSDDISRGQVPTKSSIKKTIRFLSAYKMNAYLFYLEDMVRLAHYPEIGRGRGALTSQEIKEIIDYAKNYFIEIIPVYQTLAHYETLLIKPEFFDIAEYPGSTCLSIANAKAKEFLKNSLSEIASLFESPFFHMGGDESWDMGLGKSKEWVKKLGFGAALSEHYLYVYQLLKSMNKKPILYSDMLLKSPDAIKKLPNDAIIMDWQYHPNPPYASLNFFKKKGIDFWVSPALWNWRKVFPRYTHGLSNIYHLNREAFSAGAKGSIASAWGDDGAEGLREFLYFGYAYAAASSWYPEQSLPAKIIPMILNNFFGTKDRSSVEIFESLSALSFLSDYHNLWRHPFLPLKPINDDQSEAGYLNKAYFITQKVQNIQENLKKLRLKATQNRETLAYLSFAARQILWFADKIKYSIEIKKNRIRNQENKNRLLALCDDMIRRLQEMKEDYQNLWILENRAENLHLIQKRYEMQIAYWQEKKQEIVSGQILDSPVLKSRWISHPSNPQIKKILFQKEWEINRPVQKTFLQIIAQGYAKAYVNHHYVGFVCAQRTLSLGVEFERVKVFEISKYLKQGKNNILIEFQAFVPVKMPGINVYLEQLHEQQPLLSDRSWKAAIISEDPLPKENLENYSNLLPFLPIDFLSFWRKMDLDHKKKTLHWLPALEKSPPFLVSQPNLKAERKSWIEN